MENESERPKTELLENQECWSLLRQVSVGRLAVSLEDGTDNFPVNYTVDHGTVVCTKDHFVRVVPRSISGRRFTVAPPNMWWTSGEGAKRSATE